MLQHPWIQHVEKTRLKTEVKLNAAKNLLGFRRADPFQAGIVSLMSGLLSSNSELAGMIQMFENLDSDGNGVLTPEEFHEGIGKEINEFAA